MVTVRPIDLVSRVYMTQELVYRCAKKTKQIEYRIFGQVINRVRTIANLGHK